LEETVQKERVIVWPSKDRHAVVPALDYVQHLAFDEKARLASHGNLPTDTTREHAWVLQAFAGEPEFSEKSV
jgi:hypothetical protein